LGLGEGGLGGHGGGGSPVGIQITRGPSGTGGVLPFGEFLRFPGVGVFLGKCLMVAIKCRRGSCQVRSGSAKGEGQTVLGGGGG